MIYFKNENGKVFAYDDEAAYDQYASEGLAPMTPDEVSAHLNPVKTDDEVKQSEIDQDKQYLASTDWIVAKIGEASLMRQDTAPLIEQYSLQLEAREQARIRIRINEGRA